MSRLIILTLFSCLLASQISQTKATGACNFLGIAECWNDVLAKYCEDGVCEDDPDYCKDKEILAECFRVNCDISDIQELGWVALLTGICPDHPPVMITINENE